ncbi:MAG: Zn-dependent hydrolase, partial [Saprospiraceae bacterium]|nr:Zn-dependent hydrolase [Pyrinomonadaceae bacterium]
ILNDWKTETNGVRTAGWFQQFDLPNQNVKVFFVPVRHWSRRGLFDMNKRLWGGYVIQSDTATIYFGGDSGYGRHYKEVGELFTKIDYFLIGIGAYEPRWFMEANHNSPGDAIKAFQDSGAKTMVPMHFGRFNLSDEPPNEPLRALLEEAGELSLTDKIKVLTINESLEIK